MCSAGVKCLEMRQWLNNSRQCKKQLIPYSELPNGTRSLCQCSPEREALRQCGYTRRTCDRTSRAYAQDHVQIQPVDTCRQLMQMSQDVPKMFFFVLRLNLLSNPLDSREDWIWGFVFGDSLEALRNGKSAEGGQIKLLTTSLTTVSEHHFAGGLLTTNPYYDHYKWSENFLGIWIHLSPKAHNS